MRLMRLARAAHMQGQLSNSCCVEPRAASRHLPTIRQAAWLSITGENARPSSLAFYHCRRAAGFASRPFIDRFRQRLDAHVFASEQTAARHLLSTAGGFVSMEAIRFFRAHQLAIVALNRAHGFLSIISGAPKASATMLRAQVRAGPLPIARAIVRRRLAQRVGLAHLLASNLSCSRLAM